MADLHFGFRNIELYKEDTLGTGSYGGVCKAKCDGLPCAAKIMHPTLFDLRNLGTATYLHKFEEECRLLSLAQHPNVVQYLATYRDPDTRLPVLLMELCDESLCRFLERSPGPLPYHTQLNISHDITLALVYLHSNGVIHRDLTGNNVLMIAGVRAKVTDFGMSKLAHVNPHMTPMTLCPGNVQYMSPEALEEPPSYTAKLDVFSFGVLLVQIMTRQFPNPGPRFQVVEDPRYPDGVVRIAVPETQRRSAHLKLIANARPLKGIAISCLKGKERERPSAQQLSNTVSELKRAPQYTESLQQADPGVGGGRETDSLRRQVQDLQQQNHMQEQELDEKRREYGDLRAEHGEMIVQNQQLQSRVQEERELRQTSEQLVAQFQQSLEQKDRTISDLRQTISAHERKTQQLGQQQQASSGEVTMAGTASVAKDVTKLRWKKGKKAPPESMYRGSATRDGNTVYTSGGSSKVYSCQVTPRDQQWSTLPENRYSEGQHKGIRSDGGQSQQPLDSAQKKVYKIGVIKAPRRKDPKKHPNRHNSHNDSSHYCVALYDYSKINPNDLTLQCGDVVELINVGSPDWWKGTCRGETGYFPASYVHMVSPGNQVFQALYDLVPEAPGDLQLTEGQIVVMLIDYQTGWLFGQSGTEEGLFPQNYVKRLTIV